MRSLVQSPFLLITSVGSLALAGVISACGSSGSPSGSPDSGNEGDGGCTGDMSMIAVHNFHNWCTVSLNGAATSVSSSYQVCEALGNSVPIVVGPASTMFELGPTPFVSISGVETPDAPRLRTTTGDGGLGSTSTAIVGSIRGAGCVLVCCPFTDGTGCDSSFSGYSTFLSDCP